MRLTERLFMGIGAVALAASLVTMVSPKSVHAAVAALVQVANTAASPANTEDISKQANQLVHLVCSLALTGNGFTNCYGVAPNGVTTGIPYSVPAGQNLVIDEVDIAQTEGPSASQASLAIQGIGPIHYDWFVSGNNTTQFTYPSGIVIASETSPGIIATTASSSSNAEFVSMIGYLTTN
jgi:hypothetical protein